MTRELQFPTLYQTAPHPCPYIHEKTAVNLILDPHFPVTIGLYQRLLQHGFRRNGALYYRPFCNECSACVSVRVPVRKFRPNRSQRRTQRRNEHLEVSFSKAEYSHEHFELYLRYQSSRHRGDSMDDPDPDKYRRFLVDSAVDTSFIEIREVGQLLALAIVDSVDNGLSAIYTFYDPDKSPQSLGTFAILKEIEMARILGLDYLYLGYWIADSPKMSYKSRFRPLERFNTFSGRWEDFNHGVS
ncbi:MAG: putative arginyl-tRNA--protein transferase [marine bacterium B5-7]|nr:MAG: putative arginyl-tRNA--protein transferase [marine bacterium B5-7]